MEGCGPNCARIILIFFNLIFWLSGLALLSIGIWILVDSASLKQIELISDLISEDGDQLFHYASYVLIGVGLLIAIVGFFGCCGALRENKCLLGTYVFLLVLVMLAEIGIAVLAILFQDKVDDTLGDNFKTLVTKYYVDDTTSDQSKAFQELVNSVQGELKCCGYDSYEDYGNVALDTSCCAVDDCTAVTENYDGCSTQLVALVTEQSLIVIGIGVGIACLEIFGIIFGLCLCLNVE